MATTNPKYVEMRARLKNITKPGDGWKTYKHVGMDYFIDNHPAVEAEVIAELLRQLADAKRMDTCPTCGFDLNIS